MASTSKRPSTTAHSASPAGRATTGASTTRSGRRKDDTPQPSPPWLAPTAVIFLIVGLAWMVMYYITNAQYPLPIGDWNLAAGVGIMMVGGALLTSWR